MSSFITLEYSATHPGVNRIESAIDAAQQLRPQFSGTRGLAKLLLSAVVAAVMVVAYQVMDTVAEGHLLVIWTAMWAIAFAALALFAGTALRFAAHIRSGLDAWSQGIASSSADDRLLRMAYSDPRVMADLQAAITRSETDAASQRTASGQARQG